MLLLQIFVFSKTAVLSGWFQLKGKTHWLWESLCFWVSWFLFSSAKPKEMSEKSDIYKTIRRDGRVIVLAWCTFSLPSPSLSFILLLQDFFPMHCTALVLLTKTLNLLPYIVLKICCERALQKHTISKSKGRWFRIVNAQCISSCQPASDLLGLS